FELAVDRLHVLVHRMDTETEPARDLLLGRAGEEPLERLFMPTPQRRRASPAIGRSGLHVAKNLRQKLPQPIAQRVERLVALEQTRTLQNCCQEREVVLSDRDEVAHGSGRRGRSGRDRKPPQATIIETSSSPAYGLGGGPDIGPRLAGALFMSYG